jgi:S-adenosyl-L-methionine hydrolase (adenosine-forming)
MGRPIVFLSDYGLEDEFVGICHAVLARLAPGIPVVDLTHAIPPQDVLRGALVLAQSLRYLPSGAVLLAVVDPGVGTERRPIAVEARRGGHLLVGPDNGVLSLAWEEAGGPGRAVEIRSPDVVLEPVSVTFHGRDVFSPAAAHLAADRPLEALGPGVPLAGLTVVEVPDPSVEDGRIAAEVLSVDRFGNLQLSVRPRHLDAAGTAGRIEVETPSGPVSLRRAATFADVAEGEHAAIVDSAGWVAIVLNRGNASESLGLSAGDPVRLVISADA